MFFRKKDEVKKKKQSEMAAKYPSANPRTDVTAVVTRKSAPEWAETSSRKAAPAVLWNVNEKPQLEKLPLYTGGKPTAEPAVLRDRKYAVQAATGWKQYQTDESNRTRLAADRSYQKWQSRGGVADTIDVSYKPAKNWRVSENNTFGYLYAENKERAHSYAKSLNDLLSKQMDEIGDSLRDGAQGQAEKIKDWGEKVWNTHTEAQQANAAAHEAQAEQVGQIGKQVLQKGKAAAEEAWKQQAEIQNRNSVQQIQRGKTQADAAMKAGETAMQQAGALALAQANVQKTLTDTISNVYTDFFSNPNWGKTVYETSGVTGSDQTGASVHGYRENDSWKKPTSEWKAHELEEHRRLMAENPKQAEAYAAEINDGYNRAAHEAEEQEIAERTTENEVLWGIGARVANMGNFLDVYNKALERASIGRNNESKNVNLSEIKEIVDDTNEENISKAYGEEAGKGYEFGMMLADMALGKGVLRRNLTTIRKARTAVNAVGKVNELYQKSGTDSVGEFVKNTSDKIKNIEVGSRAWFAEKQEEIEKQTEIYMKTGLSERTARWKATKELIEQSMK